MICQKNPTLRNSLALEDKLKVLRVLRLPEETAYLEGVRKRRFRAQPPLTIIERAARILNKVRIASNGCWIWGNIKPGNYAMLHENGKTIHMTHVFWGLAYGPIPHGLQALHDCPNCQDDTRCVNPDHLWLGTHQDNMDDKEAKGRGHQLSGEKCWAAKLNKESALEVRRRYKLGLGVKLAREYGVTPVAILKIVKRKSWKNI